MRKNFLKAIQTLLVFSLAFTLTSCWNFDNPLEEMGGSGSGSGSGSGGGSSDSDSTPTLTMEQTPLTFEAAEAGAQVTFTIKVATGPVEYSRDGKIWSPYTSDEAIELAAVGDKVSFRGTNAAYASDTQNSSISCYKDCYIYGNIMSLIKKEDFENVTKFTEDYTFNGLFKNNDKIKNHTDATKYLVLPATKMTAYCYYGMFFNCTGLTTTPVINVDCDGKMSCMNGMFYGCTGLTTVAEGSKISGNMGIYSCQDMFTGCAKLASVPSDLLPATSLAVECYSYMFQNCAELKKAPKLPAVTLSNGCYYWMFNGCTDLNEAWVKADYTVANNECTDMFNGCTGANDASSKFHSAYAANYIGAFAGLTNWTAASYE